MKRLNLWSVLLSLLALAVVGCAQERPPINRVQPNAMPKTFFVGDNLTDIGDDPEFYMRGTLVDVGFGASQDGLFTSTYGQPVSRVKWEITEKFLNARLAYERVAGTDNKGNPIEGLQKKTANDGQIVASYAIDKHFDIVRQYNATTGEQLNVIEENDIDRPWYERTFMRVDWSLNRAGNVYDFDTLAQTGIWGGVEYEPIAYTVMDPNDTNAPRYEPAEGYLDVTNKVFAKPQVVDLTAYDWGIDYFPACWLEAEFAGGTYPEGNCNPVELTVRYAWRKVVDTDYEPMAFDGVRQLAAGIFDFNYRMGYARNYGMVDELWYRFASRYNLWQRSHYYQDPANLTGEIPCATVATTETPTNDPYASPNRDEDFNGTADECEAVTAATGVGGSQCDSFKQRCTLPYSVRAQRIIPWYIGGVTDEDLFEATNWATLDWNLALLTSIQTARLVECRRAGISDCDQLYPMWSGQQEDYDDAARVARELDHCRRNRGWDNAECNTLLDQLTGALAQERGDPNDANVHAINTILKLPAALVLCHNPVTTGDHVACGNRGLAPRLGDIRYNSVLIVKTPQTQEPWGIMADGDDPISGEKVAASVNVWGDVTDYAAQALTDLVRYVNGELTTEEITNGQYVRDWAQANRLGAGAMPTMTKQQVNERLASVARIPAERFADYANNRMPARVRTQLAPARKQARDVAMRADAPSQVRAQAMARLNSARGSAVEAELMNPAMQQLAGLSGALPLSGMTADLVSPLGANNTVIRHEIQKMHDRALTRRGADILREAPEPSSLTAIADVIARKFPPIQGEYASEREARYQQIWRYLRKQYQYGVIGHEMGHSIGHRHNFVATGAPLFYRPQYWQLRTKNGTVTTPCTDAVNDGATCVGPRYFDPITAEEQSQMIWMFSSSSIMDYPGDVSQDMMGPGIWDFAATRLFYGDVSAVYAEDAVKGATRVGIGITNATDTFGGLVGIEYGVGGTDGWEKIHYSQLQNEFQLIRDCYPVTPQAPSYWNADTDGEWDPVIDGKIVAVDGQYSKCRSMPVDYVAYRDLRQPNASEIGNGYYDGGPSVDGQRRLRVPYSFASDDWCDLGNVSVYTHDNGGDPYEIANFFITVQENRSILDNFRRGRTTFSVRGPLDRWLWRYNDKLLGLANGLGFYANIYRIYSAADGWDFASLWPWIVNDQVKDNALAAGVAFDHFARQLSRPEDGAHFYMYDTFNDDVLRSSNDPEGNANTTAVVIPTGSTGYLRDVGFGGLPIENAMATDQGDYNTEYIMDSGSYYQKIYTAYLFALSEDRFISQSRSDFYDARYRAAGVPDIFPDGFRRVIANALTNDRSLLAPRVAANVVGEPLTDRSGYPSQPMGWVSWWPQSGPQVCFATHGRNACQSYDGTTLDPDVPIRTALIDPEIGWEVQKFLIAWTAAYIPANQNADWVDMLRIYRLGLNSAPEIDERRFEWQDPVSGEVYYARSYGKECLFGTGAACTGGKIVEKGIAARVLEYANELTAKGYQLDTANFPATPDHPAGFNNYGRAVVVRQPNGDPIVVSDPAMDRSDPVTGDNLGPAPTCDLNVDPTCTPLTVYDNHWAVALRGYKSVPDYLWQVLMQYRLASPQQLGLY